jgi:hypothetical protein
MNPQTVKASSNMKIALTSDNKTLDEVVVVAYGTTTKASFTGSAAVMKDKDMSAAKSSLIKSLEGKMAGVNLGASTGDPGSDQSILIRGIGSINGSTQPLFVIDGVPVTRPKPLVDKDGCQVMVVNKVVSVYDADGKLLRTESITDYTKKNILDSFATIDTFTSKWNEIKKKSDIADMLKEKGIDLAELKTSQEMSNVDDFDFICHIAYGKEGVGAGGDQQADRPGVVHFQTAGHGIRGIVERSHGLQHMAGGILADAPRVVENVGYGGDRYSSPSGDIFDCGHLASPEKRQRTLADFVPED